MSTTRLKTIYKFGLFEFDVDRKELRKDGIRLKVQQQPLEVLLALLERPGEVVTREELQTRIWPAPTKDLDRKLNKAVNKLRQVLGDSADAPLFIETVPRQGYRFVAPVRLEGGEPVGAAEVELPKAMPASIATTRVRRGRGWYWSVLAGLTAMVLLLVWLSSRQAPGVQLVSIRQLTTDGLEKRGRLVLANGYLYFSEVVDGVLRLARVSVEGGPVELLAPALPEGSHWCVLDIHPKTGELLIKLGPSPEVEYGEGPLWIVSPSGQARPLGQVHAQDARWSPSGDRLAYFSGAGLYVANADGQHPRRLLEREGLKGALAWSGDGKRLRFWSAYPDLQYSKIWEVSVAGDGARAVFGDWQYKQQFGEWLAGGKYFVFSSPSDFHLWIQPPRQGWWRKTEPLRLTSGPIRFRAPCAGRTASELFAIGETKKGELLLWDPDRRRFRVFLPGISADQLHFTPDGEWVTYVTYPEGDVWRARSDGSERLQLTFPPLQTYLPRYSPDGKQIVFMGRMPGRLWKILVVSAAGGTPEPLLAGEGPEADPNWSPDGKQIVYAPFPWEVPRERTGVYIVDLITRKVRRVEGSEGLYSPRWSPDGRYLVALRTDGRPWLYEFHSGKWRQLSQFQGGFPAWSRDSRWVYFFHAFTQEKGIYRVEVPSGATEEVVSLKGISIGGLEGPYGLSLSPEGWPIILRDMGRSEVYLLRLQLP